MNAALELEGRPNLCGRTLGPYRIITELGYGGMGTVYYAEHQLIGRRAAIKVLSPHVAAMPELVERFFEEARTVNDVRHPNIVDVTDFGILDGHHYLVMEFLEGETLAERLEREGPFDVDEAVRIVGEVAMALHAAHRRGVVHRDLKPENIFLTQHDNYADGVKVLDFGIAKLVSAEKENRTLPGTIMGTPAYMSPEQCIGDKFLDARSDIYSLAVVAYEMLTGAPPFEAESFGQFLLCHMHEKAELAHVRRPTIPEALSEVLDKAMAKTPAERFEDVEELRRELVAASKPAEIEVDVDFPVDEDEPPPVERAQTKRMSTKLGEIIRIRILDGNLQLPAMPTVAHRCLKMLEEDAALSQVGRELERDPLLASQLLRIVNSPIYGGRGRIESLGQAASRLGMQPLRMLLLQISARAIFQSRDPRIQQAFRAIWEHCLAVAILAREVAGVYSRRVAKDTAYMAGLLHDVGKPVVGALLLEVERSVVNGHKAQAASWIGGAAWHDVLSDCHQAVGKVIGQRWNLPVPVREAISRFHSFEHGGSDSCANIVRYTNALARREGVDVGLIDPEELTNTIMQGRSIVGVDESFEAKLTQGLRAKVEALTGEQPRRSATPSALLRTEVTAPRQ